METVPPPWGGSPQSHGYASRTPRPVRSEEHTSELQSHVNLVCRLLLDKKKRRQKDLEVASAQLLPTHLFGDRLVADYHHLDRPPLVAHLLNQRLVLWRRGLASDHHFLA